MGWKHTALSVTRRLGVLRLVEGFYGRDRLTVLAYHRVVDPDRAGFAGFRGNVSATPTEFEQQMAWVAERFTPVTIQQVAASVEGTALPDRPLLVTFDDGYRDNLEAAAPILARHGIPATIFLATDHIGTSHPFWWDLVAWRFDVTARRTGVLPLLGDRSWGDPHRIAAEWIEAAKRVPDARRREAIGQLGQVLGGGEPSGFENTLLSWDDVRALSDSGWSIGAHTCSHPILTRLPARDLAAEVKGSVDRVRRAMGTDVLGFAYPNGQPGDFDDLARTAVAEAGVPLAFTLVPGPARTGEVRADPLAIRRVYVHHGDDLVRFAAKASGVLRLVGRG